MQSGAQNKKCVGRAHLLEAKVDFLSRHIVAEKYHVGYKGYGNDFRFQKNKIFLALFTLKGIQ